MKIKTFQQCCKNSNINIMDLITRIDSIENTLNKFLFSGSITSLTWLYISSTLSLSNPFSILVLKSFSNLGSKGLSYFNNFLANL